MPTMPNRSAISWKKACMKVIHATSTSAGPIAAISQSSTAAGSKSAKIMLPMRLSPQLRTPGPSSGRVASSAAKVRSRIGTVCPSRPQS